MRKSLKKITFSAVSLIALATDLRAENVRTERITFTSQGQTLVGTLYVPAAASDSSPVPAVVVTGAWMTVKEQMAGRYARELADRGFMALAFDFRGWGESQGSPRAMEDPGMKIADIEAAAAFLDRRSDVQDGRIGGLGICASAGYVAQVAAEGRSLQSLALVAPWLHDAAIVEQVYGGKDSVAGLIATSRQAAANFAATGKESLVPAASTTDKSAIMFGVPYYTEVGRGLVPQWDNRFNLASWEAWLTFDAQTAAPKITQPTLFVHSEAAAIPNGVHQFVGNMTAKHSEVWLANITQLDFYDRTEPVRAAADAVASHFRATLR